MSMRRMLFATLALCSLCTSSAHAVWMTYSASSPAAATGTWPGGSAYSGTAAITASAFINGLSFTSLVGLTPSNIGPALSPDYFATALTPNPGPNVPFIATPYNDSGDKYHVKIDFSGTTSSSTTGVLPAGSIIAIGDLDINENYRKITATNAANVTLTTPWLAGPFNYFDMTTPMIPQSSLIPNPTITFAGGIFDMFGVSYNFDVGMWVFKTAQDVKTISFDMERGISNLILGGGGAGWAFYTPPAKVTPEPTAAAIACCGLALVGGVAATQGRRARAANRPAA